MLVPFICQIPTSPPVFCHRMSDLPSPSTSPVPTRRHDAGGAGRLAALMMEDPFIARIVSVSSALSHNTSVLPSPLKSPVSIALPEPPEGAEVPTTPLP